MIGLIAIFLILGYILAFALALKYAKKAAIKRGRPPWHFTLPTGLAMYMLVFWDLIPTYAARTYYCTVHAGLEVYVTPKEWKKNYGLVDVGSTSIEPIDPQQVKNIRIKYQSEWSPKIFGLVREVRKRIVDTKNGDVLVERIDYKTGRNSFGTGANSLGAYKSWLHTNSCVLRLNPSQKWFIEGKAFSQYLEEFKSL